MSTVLSAGEHRTEALRHLRHLRSHPDAEVQRTIREAEVEVAALPAGLDEYVAAMVPEGMEFARLELSLQVLPAGPGDTPLFYVLRRPISVLVTRDGEYFLAFSPAFLAHGTGDSVEEALRAFFTEWTHRYDVLRDLERQDRLGEPLRRELARIRRLLRYREPVPAPNSDYAAANIWRALASTSSMVPAR